MKYWSSPPGIQVAPRPPWPRPCGSRSIIRENRPRLVSGLGFFYAFLLFGVCGVHTCQ
ncbi:hypothetical protein BDW66DRAFT_142580 [Aspergillus desertorum]